MEISQVKIEGATEWAIEVEHLPGRGWRGTAVLGARKAESGMMSRVRLEEWLSALVGAKVMIR